MINVDAIGTVIELLRFGGSLLSTPMLRDVRFEKMQSSTRIHSDVGWRRLEREYLREDKARIISVAVIEDEREVREGVALLINGTEGYRCVGEYRSMEEALARLGKQTPDAVLVDIGLPGMSGIEGIRILKERFPTLTLLAFTVYDDDENIFEALRAGASGYLLKNTAPARLLEGLREVVNGGAPMSPEVARKVIKLFREVRPPHRGRAYQLTPQETEIVKLLVEGHSYKTAAAELGISLNTVSFHLRNVYTKLQVHSKSEAVSKALRNRIV
jgi:DNA-binding NarL/FixJ family response regulator